MPRRLVIRAVSSHAQGGPTFGTRPPTAMGGVRGYRGHFMSQILRRSMFAGCVLLLLTACGGGGGNGIASGGDDSNDGGAAQVPWPLSPATVRALIGGEVPAFSDRSVGQAVDGLTRSADSLLASDLLVFNSPGPPIRAKPFARQLNAVQVSWLPSCLCPSLVWVSATRASNIRPLQPIVACLSPKAAEGRNRRHCI